MNKPVRSILIIVACIACAACADAPALEAGAEPLELYAGETHAVGTVRLELDVAEGRRIPVQLWYPAMESARAAAEAGRPVLDFEPPGPHRDAWQRAARIAGDAYTQRTMHAADAPDVLAREERFPLVVFSHCNDCVRFSYFETAEALASRGFVVASVEHPNNTIYDYWNGTSVGVDLDGFLETRRLDVSTTIDILLNASAVVVPEGLRGRLDAERIAAVGHSFGALTVSYASTRDPRIRAVVFLAMVASYGDNLPVLGAELAKRVDPQPLSAPSLFIAASEDLIDIVGLNDIIRQNFADWPSETSLATLRDGGHYSVSNICGIDPLFADGCGRGYRGGNLFDPFTFLDIDTATSLTAALVTTYLELQLQGASDSTLDGIAAGAPGVLTVEHRNP
jgi:dienelactone hydrolase